jgi:hypothetical protein
MVANNYVLHVLQLVYIVLQLLIIVLAAMVVFNLEHLVVQIVFVQTDITILVLAHLFVSRVVMPAQHVLLILLIA